jgi:hypothetical protein
LREETPPLLLVTSILLGAKLLYIMIATASSLSQETLNKLYQTDAYYQATALYGIASTDEDIIDYAIYKLKQTLEYNPLSLTDEAELLIELGLVKNMEDFNNRVKQYFEEEDRIQAETVDEVFYC